MISLDLEGRRALVAGVSDDVGFGFAIARALAEAGATVCLGCWPPALGIFETLLRRGKLDAARQLSGLTGARDQRLIGTRQQPTEHAREQHQPIDAIVGAQLLGGKIKGQNRDAAAVMLAGEDQGELPRLGARPQQLLRPRRRIEDAGTREWRRR